MLSQAARLTLVLTSFAPVLLTLAVLRFVRDESPERAAGYVVAAILLTATCLLLLRFSRLQLERLPFVVRSIKTADKEILSFVLTYLLPFASDSRVFEPTVVLFVFLLLLVVVWTSHSYHFNPLLGMFGYHFYEVQSTDSITFVLITRRTLRSCAGETQVVQLTDYIVLDATGQSSVGGSE
jgi:hypothetical protein